VFSLASDQKEVPLKRYTDTFPCSCDICGKNFETLETLIKHMGSHELCELNARLNINLAPSDVINVGNHLHLW